MILCDVKDLDVRGKEPCWKLRSGVEWGLDVQSFVKDRSGLASVNFSIRMMGALRGKGS